MESWWHPLTDGAVDVELLLWRFTHDSSKLAPCICGCELVAHTVLLMGPHKGFPNGLRIADKFKQSTLWAEWQDDICAHFQMSLFGPAISSKQLVEHAEDLLHDSVLAQIVFRFKELLVSLPICADAFNDFGQVQPPGLVEDVTVTLYPDGVPILSSWINWYIHGSWRDWNRLESFDGQVYVRWEAIRSFLDTARGEDGRHALSEIQFSPLNVCLANFFEVFHSCFEMGACFCILPELSGGSSP